MTILLKKKHSLVIGNFIFKCSIGKNGVTNNKLEGDKKTPRGTYKIGDLYFRGDKIKKPQTMLNTRKIVNNMGWCNDTRFPKQYNKLIKTSKKIKHERLKRKDYKYDLLIPIKYNYNKPIVGLGSCIFLHITKNFMPTAGCIAIKKNDFLILLKLIKKNTRIRII